MKRIPAKTWYSLVPNLGEIDNNYGELFDDHNLIISQEISIEIKITCTNELKTQAQNFIGNVKDMTKIWPLKVSYVYKLY